MVGQGRRDRAAPIYSQSLWHRCVGLGRLIVPACRPSAICNRTYFSALKTKLLASNKHRCQLVICSISAFTVGPVPQRTHPYSCRGCPKAYLPVLNVQKHLISTEKHEALQYRRAVNRMEEAWCLDFAFVLLKPRPKMCIRLNLSRSRRNYRRRRPNRSQMIKIKRTRLPIPPPT
jgi:hypothetical protein